MLNKLKAKFKNWPLVLSLIFLLPALLVAGLGIIQSAMGITELNDWLDAYFWQKDLLAILKNPAVIVGGIILALTFNIGYLAHTHGRQGFFVLQGNFTSYGRSVSWLIIFSCLFFGLIIFLYLLAENLQLFAI